MSIELKVLGLEQKEIAKLLGVSAPAVSQYITEKRGADVQFNERLRQKIQEAAARIANKGSMLHETQDLIHSVKHERITCGVCQYSVAGVPEDCMACFKER